MSELVVKKEKNCIGCELCVMECQRQLKKVGLSGSYIRILRNYKKPWDFKVNVDPRIKDLDIKKIVGVCPTKVFEEAKEDAGE